MILKCDQSPGSEGKLQTGLVRSTLNVSLLKKPASYENTQEESMFQEVRDLVVTGRGGERRGLPFLNFGAAELCMLSS